MIGILEGSEKIVRDGLVLHLDAAKLRSYPGSGTSWTDLSGRGNTATLVNGPTYSSNNGGYLIFDGTNEYAEVTNSASINDCLASDFTYELWTLPKITGFSFGKLFAKGRYLQSTGFNGLTYRTSDGRLNFQYGNPNTAFIITSYLQEDIWHHIVITRNSSTINCYVDNILTQTLTNTYNFSSTFPLRISANSQPNPDDAHQFVPIFRQYSIGLSDSQVSQNFNALRGRFGI